MTSTTPPPDERPEGETRPEEPARDETPTEQAAAVPAPPPPGDHRPLPPPPPGYGPHPYPFAPVVRTPLVNPQRRGAVAGFAAGALVVALAAGFGIGYAVAPSHDGRGHHRMERGYYPGGQMGGGMMPRQRQIPNGQFPNGRMPRQFPGNPGQPSSSGYEGEGYVIVRDPDTEVVRDALRRIVTGVRVELVEHE